MKILAIDLETTGLLDDENARVTEVAYALWDTEIGRIIKSKSYLVNCVAEGAKVSEDITRLTGITEEMLKEHGCSSEFMVTDLNEKLMGCDAVMARNANFDKSFVEREFKKNGYDSIPDRDWICTKIDVMYPDKVTGRSQSHVAADHGFLNPFPHWAIGDVLTMLRIHEIGEYGWEEPLRMAQSPLVKVIADVPFRRKDEAKKLGFRWDGEGKVWFKEIKQLVLDAERKHYTFNVKVVP